MSRFVDPAAASRAMSRSRAVRGATASPPESAGVVAPSHRDCQTRLRRDAARAACARLSRQWSAAALRGRFGGVEPRVHRLELGRGRVQRMRVVVDEPSRVGEARARQLTLARGRSNREGRERNARATQPGDVVQRTRGERMRARLRRAIGRAHHFHDSRVDIARRREVPAPSAVDLGLHHEHLVLGYRVERREGRFRSGDVTRHCSHDDPAREGPAARSAQV